MASRRKIVATPVGWKDQQEAEAQGLIIPPEPPPMLTPFEALKLSIEEERGPHPSGGEWKFKGRKPGPKGRKDKMYDPTVAGYMAPPTPTFTPHSNPAYISIHRALDSRSEKDFTEAVMDFRLFFRDKNCRAMAVLLDVHVATIRKWLVGTHIPGWLTRFEMLVAMLWYADLQPGDRVEGLFTAAIPLGVTYEPDWVLVRHRNLISHDKKACGHFVIVNGMEYRSASAEHPNTEKDSMGWAQKFVAFHLGPAKVNKIKWDACDIKWNCEGLKR